MIDVDPTSIITPFGTSIFYKIVSGAKKSAPPLLGNNSQPHHTTHTHKHTQNNNINHTSNSLPPPPPSPLPHRRHCRRHKKMMSASEASYDDIGEDEDVLAPNFEDETRDIQNRASH